MVEPPATVAVVPLVNRAKRDAPFLANTCWIYWFERNVLPESRMPTAPDAAERRFAQAGGCAGGVRGWSCVHDARLRQGGWLGPSLL